MIREDNLAGVYNVRQMILFESKGERKTSEYSDVDFLKVSPDFEGKNHLGRSLRVQDYWIPKRLPAFLATLGAY